MSDKRVRLKYKVSDDHLEELIFQYCREITELEREGRFDPITGRDQEIDDMVLILLQKGRKNVMLLAPAGVGKTALAVGLAQKIVQDEVPELLQRARLVELDLSAMAAGTSTPAEFQERFIPICKGMAERYHDTSRPRFIMFIDEIHMIMPKVEGSGYSGLSDVMKPYLTVGDMQVIGATTADEYRWYVQRDEALDRRFQKIHLRMPNVPETINILKNVRPSYEKHHGITIPDIVIEKIVFNTEEHMRRRTQPDKSIISLDAACAHYVKNFGRGGELTLDSAYYMLARETGLHVAVFDDRMKYAEDVEAPPEDPDSKYG